MESAEDSAASLMLFAFNLPMHRTKLGDLHFQHKMAYADLETLKHLYLIFRRDGNGEATLGQR